MKILIYHSNKDQLSELLQLVIQALNHTKAEIDCFYEMNYQKINRKQYDLAIINMSGDYLSLTRHLEYNHCMNILLSQSIDNVAIALYMNAYAFIYKRYHFNETILKAVNQYKMNHVCLFIETERKKVQILLKDIVYIEMCGDEAKVITKDCIYHGEIKDLQTLIPKLYQYQFVQVHRNFIIHTSYVQGYRQKEVIMTNDHVIPLSLKYKHVFMKVVL